MNTELIINVFIAMWLYNTTKNIVSVIATRLFYGQWPKGMDEEIKNLKQKLKEF